MNIIRRELQSAILDYQSARFCVAQSNRIKHDSKFDKGGAMRWLNRARGRLMNLVRATNTILNRRPV